MCVEFILCKRGSVYVIEYSIVDDKCELTTKQSFDFGEKFDANYDRDCGMCVLSSMSESKSDNEFKSNDMNANEETYDIILFGVADLKTNFLSSLQWLSLKIVNNRSYIISIENEKTKQFQNTFVDQKIVENGRYYSFGYTKWKHYLILFGGLVDYGETKIIDSIFYFDFFEMKWHKSLKVL